MGHQKAVPSTRNESSWNRCTSGLLEAALQSVGACQSHIAPTPRPQVTNGGSLVGAETPCFARTPSNASGGTTSTSSRCCSM